MAFSYLVYFSCADSPFRATTATPLNPIVDSFTPNQAIPYHHESTIAANNYLDVQQDMVDPYALTGSAENYLAVQQAMINPYASTVSGDNYHAVQQTLPDAYSSAFPGEDYLAVQQAAPLPYESTFPSHDYSAVQQVLLNPYASTLPINGNENFAAQHAQEYQQQFYSPNGQAVMTPYYGSTGPMGFAGTVPTSGPTSQFAAVSPHHAPVENTLNAKNAAKLPQHKPGKECPEENTNCHWHYTGWCHRNPATCPLARKSPQPLVNPVFINSILQFKLSQLPSMPTESGDMLPQAGTRLISLASASRTLSCARSMHSWLAECSVVPSTELYLCDKKDHMAIR